MAWFTAIPWRRFFWSKILKYLLHLFYLYILCGWSHVMLSQRMLWVQGKETVCYLNVSTQVPEGRKARLSFIPRNATHRSSQVNLLFTHSNKSAPTRCTVFDTFRRFLTICSIERNNNVLNSISSRYGVPNRHGSRHHHMHTDRTLYKILKETSNFWDELISNRTFQSVSFSASINKIIFLFHRL